MSDYRASVTESLAQNGDAARLVALARMADAAAHEFNNLRSAIEGTLDLIATDPRAAMTERRLVRLRSASTRAGGLAEGLAALARLRRGSDTPLDIGAWLLGARSWLTERTGAGITLEVAVPSDPVMVIAHPDSLRVVVRALIANALAAMESKGSLAIAVGQGRNRRTSALSIADDGPGMAPGIMARAREPFFTTRPPAAGLGLTLAELFAKEHGGTLELSSSPGRGTIVSLHLPKAVSA